LKKWIRDENSEENIWTEAVSEENWYPAQDISRVVKSKKTRWTV
jgi:hypothetical protein